MNDSRPYSPLQIRDLGERDLALTNPSAIELLAGAEGATFLALLSRI